MGKEYVSFADQNHAPSLTDVRLELRNAGKRDKRESMNLNRLIQISFYLIPRPLLTSGIFINVGVVHFIRISKDEIKIISFYIIDL